MYISAKDVELTLEASEALDVAFAIQHHLEQSIDNHWKNYPGEFEKREGTLIRIMEEFFASCANLYAAKTKREELLERLKKASTKEEVAPTTEV